MEWPITKEIQEKIRKSPKWSNVMDFIPEIKPGSTCKHGFEFDTRCPKSINWLQSSSVKIYDQTKIEKSISAHQLGPVYASNFGLVI